MRWFESDQNVLDLARWLVEEECLDASELLSYFEKPWKWEREWNEYRAALVAEAEVS